MPPQPQTDESFMRRALRLAMNGRGHVEPNPMVGCVLVKEGRVIGAGYHAQYGGPHAEPTALANCTESPEGATAYVTLEPCCHTNKKTPPCAPRLIEAKVKRVVIGCLDPNPEVNGKGVAMLRAAGITVDGPVLEGEAKQLIAPFIRRQDGRTYRTMKWAESSDGKVAGPGGKRLQISNALSTQLVHSLRARCDAITVGIGTVLADDPLLTARDVANPHLLRRFVLDTHLRIPLTSRIVQTAREIPTCVLSGPEARWSRPEFVRQLEAAGVAVMDTDDGLDGRVALEEYFSEVDMAKPPITHGLIESGPTLARELLSYVQRLWVFRSPTAVGDDSAPSAARITGGFVKTAELDVMGDLLTEYLNQKDDVFFAAVPSADFVLARDAVESGALIPSPGTPGEG